MYWIFLLLTIAAMDLGPVFAVMPDIVTFEIATGNSKEDVMVSCSHEHSATSTPYTESNEDSSNGDDNIAADIELKYNPDD